MQLFIYNGTTISYLDIGSGIPVVFIHGSLGSKNLWRDQIDPFAKTYRVIAIDVRGHGESTKPERGYRPNDMLGDVGALLDYLEIDRAIIVGSSMDGALAEIFCLSHPERVLGLVLVGTLARAHWRVSQEEYSRTSFENIVDIGVRQWFVNSSSKEDIDFALEQAKVSSPNFILHVMQDFGNYDFRDRLNAIKVPPIVIVGKEDETTPLVESQIIYSGIVDSQLHIIPNSGHLVMLEQSEIFNQIVLEFLKRNFSVDNYPASSNQIST